MAVKLVSERAQQYQCYSSDVKPTAPSEGSKLLLIDTGERCVFYLGMWVEDLSPASRTGA